MLTIRRIAALAMLVGVWWIGAAYATGSIVVHMALHLVVVAVVPALLSLTFADRPGPVFLGLAVVVEMVAVWGWHTPAAHAWARLSTTGFVLEQASFLGAGTLLWAAAQSAGRFGGAAVLLGTVMHMTLLGAIIGLAPRSVYNVVCAGYFGLDAIEEQQLAGAMMATLGGAFYLAAALHRLGPLLRLDEERIT